MTKNEKALDSFFLAKFGLGFSDLIRIEDRTDLTQHATGLFAAGFTAREVFEACCDAWSVEGMTFHEAKKAATEKTPGVVYEGDAGDGYAFEVFYCTERERRVWTLITPDWELDALAGSWSRKKVKRRRIACTEIEMMHTELCHKHPDYPWSEFWIDRKEKTDD